MTQCKNCQTEMPSDAKFCGNCGTAMSRCCTSCGAEMAADANFCAKCGASASASVADNGSSARTLTVDASGSTPYRTIMSAMEDAQSGDIIRVLPGEYREAIEFKEGVTLLGTDREKCRVVFQEREQGWFNKQAPGIEGANRATIKNFSIKTMVEQIPLFLDGTDMRLEACILCPIEIIGGTPEIINCMFQGRAGVLAAIKVRRGAKPRLISNTIRGWVIGINFEEQSRGTVEGNTIERNDFGIIVGGHGSSPDIKENEIRSNTSRQVSYSDGAVGRNIE